MRPTSGSPTRSSTRRTRRNYTMSFKTRPAGFCLLLPMLLLASACADSGGFPPLADLKAVTEPKPVPSDEIATDPQAEANYNASVEGWGERLRSAGIRLCRFFDQTG